MLKIGITERGDAGIDFSWYDKIKQELVGGAILITKNVNKEFAHKVLDLYEEGFKIIVHCTCTGYGGTALEPNVPDFWGTIKRNGSAQTGRLSNGKYGPPDRPDIPIRKRVKTGRGGVKCRKIHEFIPNACKIFCLRRIPACQRKIQGTRMESAL